VHEKSQTYNSYSIEENGLHRCSEYMKRTARSVQSHAQYRVLTISIDHHYSDSRPARYKPDFRAALLCPAVEPRTRHINLLDQVSRLQARLFNRRILA
jgi:hypothetical protein